MNFYVEDVVKQLGVKVVGVAIKGLNNDSVSDDFIHYRNNEVDRLRKKYQNFSIATDEILNGFYELHTKVGVGRRKNVPASENLITHLMKNNDLYSINKVVDIYNLISIDTKLALGAHDMDFIEGNVSLRLTNGSELFIPLGQEEPKQVKVGEYSYIDDANEVICRLEIRQVNKTMVTEKTTNVFYIVQGNDFVSEEYIESVAQRLIDETTKYCGGVGSILK